MLEADIYVTVSDGEKRRYLTESFGIPETRIFQSRNASFVDDIMRETHGKGVNVALNSLSGELLHATWRCVARWGTMVEIGKRDLLGRGKLDMDVFLDNRSYCCVDMDQMAQEKPGEINRLLHDMMNYFRQGQLRPIRLARVSGASGTEIRETFLEMQQGKHIGKMVVELRDHTGQLRFGAIDCAKGADTVKLDGSASYLLVGGLGGLGRSISIWMAQKGARNLTFLSRSAGVLQQHKDFARELESMGCTVQFVQGSVTSAANVARAIDSTLGPLKGIIQMSMVLRDQAFLRMSLEDWDQATQPKVQGTWNLHNVSQSRHIALDFFVLFSSLSGIVGQSGQANYASANTFLDAFVRYRNSLKLPCTAIDLGMMESQEELFAVLEAAMAAPVQGSTGQQQSEALISSPSKYSNRVDYNSFILGISPTDNAQQKADVRFAVYHNTDGRGRGVSGSGGSSSNDALRTLLAEGRKDPDVFGSDETIVFLATEIGRKLLALLLRSDEAVDVASRTAELGLDSLVAIEMRSWWKLVFGFDIIVLDMLSIGTLDAMGRRVADELLALHHK
ncbi:hypothetical protein CHU98_g7116 [Xylaria longipes]|nr:hypothetical protein CHU98_g7116 [Xylaria longipes]